MRRRLRVANQSLTENAPQDVRSVLKIDGVSLVGLSTRPKFLVCVFNLAPRVRNAKLTLAAMWLMLAILHAPC